MPRLASNSVSTNRDTHRTLTNLPQAMRDRIAHIDFILMFKGIATRTDVTERFSVAATQATKDFALYHKLAPNNIIYDPNRKLHIRAETFKPVFPFDVVRTLATLSQGYGDGFAGVIKQALPCEAPFHLNKPSLDIVAKVTEAIFKESALSITYVSLSSGESTRQIIPHTLVDSGQRWHVRAFDRKHQEFRDFVLTRIKSAKLDTDTEVLETETETFDRQWSRFVELELVPHPGIKNAKAIMMDYGMKDGVLRTEVRAATAGYLLQLWNVDCSDDASYNVGVSPLYLRNKPALYGVKNMEIAPGYSKEK